MSNNDERFEDIVDELMLEEETPGDTALARWCERYPQHRKALEEFFAVWAVQAELPQRTRIDEKRLAERSVSYAKAILKRQGLGPVPPKALDAEEAQSQAQLEQLVLKAVHLLGGEADTANIAHKVSELTGKPITTRAVDESLVRLEGRQLVESRVAHPAQEPEGQLKRYSKITPAGERALGVPEATAGESIDALGDLT